MQPQSLRASPYFSSEGEMSFTKGKFVSLVDKKCLLLLKCPSPVTSWGFHLFPMKTCEYVELRTIKPTKPYRTGVTTQG